MRSSHLLRVEQKKARRRILYSLLILVAIITFFAFEGIPIFTRFSLLLTSGNKNKDNQTNNSLPLNPPHLAPIYEATNSATISVSGFADSGETVILIVNGQEDGKILVGNDGRFNMQDVELKEGTNNIAAKASKNGKQSLDSENLSVTYKKAPPALNISTPSDNQNFIGDDNPITISGKTDSDAKVTINGRLIIVNTDGSFNTTLSLTEGDTQIKIVATDIASNQTKIMRKVSYKK